MSESDQQNTPLTRRQMRELRNTGATPVIPPAGLPEDVAAPQPEAPAPIGKNGKPAKPTKAEKAEAAAAQKAAAKAAAEPAPAPVVADAADLGVAPLTRRAARQQERIRTASIPVVSSDLAPAPEAQAPTPPAPEETPLEPAEAVFRPPISRDDAGSRPLQVAAAELAPEETKAKGAGVTVNPSFGAALLAGEGEGDRFAPGASFDQLVARSGAVGGSVATPNALILSQSPASAPLVAPITATGELLVTGTFALPEGLGSTGHVPGAADGAEADVVLIDGELPASSSPTPIAASAAISTVKDNDEIIRPPAPERGSRLLLVLAITAGALALALVGVLIAAVVTGVFS